MEILIRLLKSVTEELLSHNALPFHDGKRSCQLKLNEGYAYTAFKNWDAAYQNYKNAFGEARKDHPIMQDQAAFHMSRATYETLMIGRDTIQVCQSAAGVHKSVALAQKAKGGINGAKKTMSRAVLYEAGTRKIR